MRKKDVRLVESFVLLCILRGNRMNQFPCVCSDVQQGRTSPNYSHLYHETLGNIQNPPKIMTVALLNAPGSSLSLFLLPNQDLGSHHGCDWVTEDIANSNVPRCTAPHMANLVSVADANANS